jgi:hypothetical protein
MRNDTNDKRITTEARKDPSMEEKDQITEGAEDDAEKSIEEKDDRKDGLDDKVPNERISREDKTENKDDKKSR